jgi:hypothetical protein
MEKQICKRLIKSICDLVLIPRSYNYDPSALYNDDAYPIGRFSNEFGFHSSKFAPLCSEASTRTMM